jgi:hypothetical protein
MWRLASNQAECVDPPILEGFLLGHTEIPPELLAELKNDPARLKAKFDRIGTLSP